MRTCSPARGRASPGCRSAPPPPAPGVAHDRVGAEADRGSRRSLAFPALSPSGSSTPSGGGRAFEAHALQPTRAGCCRPPLRRARGPVRPAALRGRGRAACPSRSPGRNRLKAISRSSRLSYQRLLTRKKPWVAAAKISIATVATTKISTPWAKPTSIEQQVGVEDEQERQRRGAQAVEERHQAGLDRVALGHRGGGERRQAHRRGDVGHDAEVEDEQVHGDQRHDQTVLLAEGDDHRRQQAGHHDVVGGGRQAHAEDQAEHRGEGQHQQQVAHRQELDQVGEHQADAGLRHRTDDDPGGGRGDADADHVARAGDQALARSASPCLAAVGWPPVPRSEGEQRALGEQDHHQHHGAPEGRQAGDRRSIIRHQTSTTTGQQEVQAGEQHRAGFRQRRRAVCRGPRRAAAAGGWRRSSKRPR